MTALQAAFTDALSIVSPLTTTIDQVVPSLSLISVLSGLTVGLAFLGVCDSIFPSRMYSNFISQAPDMAVIFQTLQTVIRVAAQTLSVGLQQAPGVAKSMWPTGSSDSQTYQISALDGQLETIQKQMAGVLNQGLLNVMSDLPTFVNFTQNGAFTTSQSLSLPNATNGLDFALKTYMTSESLLQNNFYAQLDGPMPAANAFQNMPAPACSNVTGGIICSEDTSNTAQSDGTFWSSATSNYYLLTSKGNKVWSYPILSSINSNGWADLGTLFDGSYNCTFSGKLL